MASFAQEAVGGEAVSGGDEVGVVELPDLSELLGVASVGACFCGGFFVLLEIPVVGVAGGDCGLGIAREVTHDDYGGGGSRCGLRRWGMKIRRGRERGRK